MSEPNPWLPDATGKASANDYDYSSQNGQGGSAAAQAATAIVYGTAKYAAKRYGPTLVKKAASMLRGVIR